ncbi:NAD(P)H-quinone dehydrogenase [Litorihabitans aurantiacus]|uniref:NAD(P)H-quinone dehydrogenase n=1 Tax=Litorihabitans aurantiacus TaxID=1930061 RepID=A0AA38CS27_9MICO|nr:NAD(P)H-quinone dehydrogenase [Litorihabitans aurantiacus]GMA32156.1 NAD(P)H-quinone dehydrogenase [Litorihabitans aurantiacus]
MTSPTPPATSASTPAPDGLAATSAANGPGKAPDAKRGASSTRLGSQVVIVGGGPGGYEAALVAAQLKADVTLVERQGLGGAAVLTDVVPSKTLIATAEWRAMVAAAGELGIRAPEGRDASLQVDLGEVNARVVALAQQQSRDIRANLEREGVRIVEGTGRLAASDTVEVTGEDGEQELPADVVLLATGATPRELPTAVPDGERILTWTQVYSLAELPQRLVVVGSGVTGAEFAGAFSALGVDVVLISSRERVLPGEDADAAELVENAFRRGGMEVLSRSRAAGVVRRGDEVVVTLTDGREVTGSHCLLAVGGIPNTEGLGLAGAGVATTDTGHITVDRVSRTTVRGVYAAGDVTGVLPLASVAATQGRIAMWHALGDAVAPLDVRRVPATVFTSPEIATVGVSEVDAAAHEGRVTTVPLARNPRAKMLGIHEGFVKVISREGSGSVLGGVVVAPRASELIHVLTLAVASRVTVDQLASAMTIYPSLSGSIAEGARRLHAPVTD